MWRHYCRSEKGWLRVAEGEPCNWCDEAQMKPRHELLEQARVAHAVYIELIERMRCTERKS